MLIFEALLIISAVTAPVVLWSQHSIEKRLRFQEGWLVNLQRQASELQRKVEGIGELDEEHNEID